MILCKHGFSNSPFTALQKALNVCVETFHRFFFFFLLTLNPIQQQINSILVVAESCLIVLVDLAVQRHTNLLGRLNQVVSLCHRCLVLNPPRAKWT